MATLFKKKFMRVPNMHFGNAIKEIGRNAYVDWIIVILVSIFIALGLVAGGIHLYWQISSGNFKGSENVTDAQKKIFDEKQLSDVIEKFDAKEERILEIKKGYSGPPDPIR